MELLASLEYGSPYLELECEFNLDLTAPSASILRHHHHHFSVGAILAFRQINMTY
ncbi:hypothetical protein D3C84_217320 [compost metagenome]|jgi:hypothetical protein